MERRLERITVDMGADQLEQDLERYRQLALELGASQAKILDVEDIVVDDRVSLKCQIPRCFGYGACAHCPPHTMKPSELREHLSDVVQELQDSQAAHYLARIEGQESYIGELEAERKHLHRNIQELEGRLAALNENSFTIRALKKLKIIKVAQEY